MSFSPSSILARLTKPFTSTAQMGISAESAGAASAVEIPANAQRATIAAGCFWGVEHAYRRQFREGLYDARVGYIGGDRKNPSYDAVCSGRTGRE